MASFSDTAFSTNAFDSNAFAFGVQPTPTIVIDTHDGDRYKKRTESHRQLREMLERLIDGPVLPELVEEAEAAISEPTEDALAAWVEELEARAAERHRNEEEDEEILAMAIL